MTESAGHAPAETVEHEGVPRGWHPNPENPKRERWHDGVRFTEHTHRALRRPSMFGAAYDRSMWPGANADARGARRASDVASVLFFLVIVGLIMIPTVPWAFTVVGIGMFAIAIASTLQVALGVRAVRRASLDGGLGIAVIVIVQGSIYLFLAAVYLALRLALAVGS